LRTLWFERDFLLIGIIILYYNNRKKFDGLVMDYNNLVASSVIYNLASDIGSVYLTNWIVSFICQNFV